MKSRTRIPSDAAPDAPTLPAVTPGYVAKLNARWDALRPGIVANALRESAE